MKNHKNILQKFKISLLLLTALHNTDNTFAQTWAPMANLGTGRDGAIIFSINNKIYVGAGSTQNDFWAYDPASNAWTQKASIPGPTGVRGFAVGFSVNGKGYIGLGTRSDSTTTVLNDIWEYDTSGNSWIQKNNFPGVSRDGAFSFVINDTAYVGGGNDSLGNLHNDFWMYNASADTWVQKANVPDYLIFPFTFSINGQGYISCGASSSETIATYMYNPASDAWSAKAGFPGAARQAGASFVLNNKAYCGIGQAQYDTVFNDFYVYDPSANSWAFAGTFPGGAAAWPVGVACNNAGYVGTGWNFGSSLFNDWYQYTLPATNVASTHSENSMFSIYPNPVINALHVQFSGAIFSGASFALYNMLGEKTLWGNVHTDNTIDASTLPAGQYILEIISGNGNYHHVISVLNR
jgi:N-acetylneuraminic acid mutarotase